MVRSSAAREFSLRVRSEPLRARNPSKVNRPVGSPESASAVNAAEGPGITVTGRSASATAHAATYPGSEIVGIPASESSRTVFPSLTACTSWVLRYSSLWSWFTITRPVVRTPSPEARVRSLRVSSTAITSAVVSACRNRSLASERLPIGVPPRMRTPPPVPCAAACGPVCSAGAWSGVSASGVGVLFLLCGFMRLTFPV